MIRTVKFLLQRIPFALLVFTILLAVLQPCPCLAGPERVSIIAADIFPFYLDGRAYIISPGGSRWAIKENPKDGFTPVSGSASSCPVSAFFTLNDRPYIFGLLKGKGGDYNASICGISEGARDLPRVMDKGKMSSAYRHVVSFQLNGKPYILGLHNDVGANIWSIDQGPKGMTFNLVKYKQKMSPNYKHLVVFYREGHPYIFGVHAGYESKYLGQGVGANIWRVRDNPAEGLDLVMYAKDFHRYYDYLTAFHLGGQPYIFAAKLIRPETEPMFSSKDLPFAVLDNILDEKQGYGVIWKIEGDPRKPTLRRMTKKGVPISYRYQAMTTFEQGGKAYIFGIHEENYANIWRVFEDDPAKGFTLEYYGRNK